MIHSPRILVIGNYPADRQQSMARFAQLLVRIYKSDSKVSLVFPAIFVNRFPCLPKTLRKYLGYIDKLILFPIWLSLKSHSWDLVHIADHSNSYYSFCFPPSRCIVTCHDLLAMRGSFGDPAAACSASRIGIWLQRLIKAGLRRPQSIVFDSYATFEDFKHQIGISPRQRHTVIPLSLNARFTPNADLNLLSFEELEQLPPRPYLLMVGSALPRKNRILALQLLVLLGEVSHYSLVFAGAPLSEDELIFSKTHPLGSRLFSIVGPSHLLLNSLYCHAHALVFPSFSEGFGWPLLEAQACSCPVIASTTTSIPEVAGAAALFAEPTDVGLFAAHVRTLENPILRDEYIRMGHVNLLRFKPEIVAESYRSFAFR
jgi:glycosyltransferase involved in cell wall biosynthesis